MPFRRFASAVFLEAHMGGDAGFAKSAHRAVFNYTPREGYLYVRSRAISSRCNDNFDMFPAEEIEKSYLTFIGKPVFVNHHNEDHRRARGVIIDAALHKDRNPDGSPDTWSEVLMEVDAVRFPRLAKAILAGEVDRTSMGCDVQLSKCSVCGNEATSPLQYCAHIPGKKGKKIYKIDPRTGAKSAQLVFEICSGLSFFENSLLVEAPADPTAFFLGKVEVGPGLEHLTAGLNKTATRKQAVAPVTESHDYSLIGEDEARGNSRPVSEDEFHALAQHGKQQYQELASRPGGTHGLDANWEHIKNHGYAQVQHSWGGATYNAETGHPLETNADKYALTARPPGPHQISVHEHASFPEFSKAMDQARHQYGEILGRKDHHLGVFHDDENKRVDIDPVLVVHHPEDVESIGAYTHATGGAYHFKSGDGYFPPHVKGFRSHSRLTKRAATEPLGEPQNYGEGDVPNSKKTWELIREATVSGDDLFDWDFVAAASNAWVDDETGLRVTAATNAETDDWHRDHTAHPKNLVDLFNFAVDHNYHKDLPKMENHEAAIHHGMNWYSGMHAVGESLAKSAHPSLGVNAKGEKDDNLLRHRVFGALGVYSEGTDVPMNYHQASLATSKGRPLWSKDTGMDKDEQTHEFGTVKDTDKDSPTKGQMVPGKPKSMEDQAKKVGLLFSPNLNHMHEVVKAAKTSNYSALGMHGGDEPDTKFGIDQIHSGYGKGGRVVIDRHALSAAAGHRIDGVDFNSAGLSKYQKPTKSNPGELAHLHTEYGNDENKHYSFVADAYRVAAQHLSNHHGREITPQQVQAVTWGTQKHMNDNGIMRQPSLPSKKSSWSNADEDTWKGVVNSKHSWINDSDNDSVDRTRSFKDRPNTRNINNWERHLDDRPDIGKPINEHFKDYGPRGHWGKKLAYGETKSPEDVDTLRSENCTVCGNSSAWDGTQCQVCGYVAPPRPFGDPNTDIAQQKDIRKQVLDGNEADPNDPDQQLGQQIGDPNELQDQQDGTAAGEDTQLGTLTCNVCGTGLQPAPPTSESGDGEPAYPAEGDVCPVCKKGQLLAEGGGEEGLGDEAGMDSVDAEEGQEGDAPGGASQQQLEEDDGDEAANEEFKGKQDGSDDDDEDDGDSFDPKKKADKEQKTSSFVPVWWKPSWWKA